MKPGSRVIWSLFIPNLLILEITEICSTMMARERRTISPDDKLYALGSEKERDRGRLQTDRREKEREIERERT